MELGSRVASASERAPRAEEHGLLTFNRGSYGFGIKSVAHHHAQALGAGKGLRIADEDGDLMALVQTLPHQLASGSPGSPENNELHGQHLAHSFDERSPGSRFSF